MPHAKKFPHSHAVQDPENSNSRAIEELSRQTEELIQAARDDGFKRGKRRAKGKSEFAQPHGRPKLLNDIWALQFVDFVDARLADGKTSVGAAVEKYRDAMARGLKAEGVPSDLSASVFEQDRYQARGALMNLYRRIKNGRRKIEAQNREAYLILKHSESDA